MTIKNLYLATYSSLSDLCNIRNVILHNSKNHYNFNKYCDEASINEFIHFFEDYLDEKLYNNYLFIYETSSKKLKELDIDKKKKTINFIKKYLKSDYEYKKDFNYLFNEIIYTCENQNIDYDVDNLKKCSYFDLKDIKSYIDNDFDFEDIENKHLQEVIDYIS